MAKRKQKEQQNTLNTRPYKNHKALGREMASTIKEQVTLTN